ncbi:MAG: C2H2-type zinc finger protein [Candidatus Nanohaloarchaea archaeon]
MQCSFCGDSFDTERGLHVHQAEVHDEVEKEKRRILDQDAAEVLESARNSDFDPAELMELFEKREIEPDDIRVYRCDMCMQRFRSSRALQEHKKDVHSGELEQCDYCEEKFALHKSLLRHKLKQHRDTLEQQEPFLLETLEEEYED